MSVLLFTALVLCFFIHAGECQQITIIVNDSQINVTAGGEAFFSVRPTVNVSSGSWSFKGKTIAQWIGQSEILDTEYRSRAELFTSNGSLLLKSVRTSDSGEYRVNMLPVSGSQTSATITLKVIELISNVSVNISNSQPTENDTVLFTCAAKGTIQRRTWFKDDKLVQSEGRIITSPDNVSLTITGLLRNDTGKYKCNVSNGFSSDSAEIGLQVNYGPDNITIHPQGPVEKYTGDFLTLQCFADTVPSGEYTWYNGTNIVIKGQTYNITSVRKFDSGNYTCLVNNNITMKNNSLSVMVFIQDPVPTESPPGGSGGLSGGAIAGIVIGVIAGVVLVCGLAYCIIKTKTSRLNTGFGKSDPKGTSPENIPSSQTEYAEIERKKPSQPKPAPSSNGANAAPAQAKDEDVIYTRPNIINPGTKPTSEALVDNKTDYAEVKYR
ncbi:pregnancy-specific beta-1-glycoprotein 5 isoform X5 [Hemitrygon akajei]|uniref:pregnancy-specific beta-1-glycoprotein 5 isoform X5 n=1 Tax=Hemitrygon akajei TaxID=2704970 RepID=UPI003BF9FBA2